ncbi:helix-turn-helix transcriptional regulator [Shewanella baltica]|uniref:Bacteriophage CI repressor n=1 Tax=Shewanella baltica (strain OS155 / ATCC BAA-1091) TaxID=325240 RepID=A3D224_SHEB5|nr:helix-turn-helix transcriptional regulator [Shewanella baltica]ABN60787.1 bacteriophage CI repressor [Shewanella baltica OS155]AEH13133.1 CI repressor [Shewanella baltica OS117]
MKNFVNIQNTQFRIPLNSSPEYDGGDAVILRLLAMFGVRNRLELGEVLGVSSGTFATWKTRNTTPFELLIRIHLATGVPMEYLCFGHEDETVDLMKYGVSKKTEYVDGEVISVEDRLATYRLPSIKISSIENGHLKPNAEICTDKSFMRMAGIEGIDSDLVIKESGQLLFINSNETSVSNGRYLFAINDTYQIGDLRMLPDGHVYLFHAGDKYQVDPNTTKIHGKVVSVLETV